MKQRKKTGFHHFFFVLFVSFIGVFGLTLSLLNAFFLDYLKYRLQKPDVGEYRILCDSVSGNLFKGFLIEGVHFVPVNSGEDLIFLNSFFLKISPFELLERNLVVEKAFVNGIHIYADQLEEFFFHLHKLFDLSKKATSRHMLFRKVEFQRLGFYQLRVINPLALLSMKDKLKEFDFQISEDIYFDGQLFVADRQLRLKANTKLKRIDSSEEKGVYLEAVLDLDLFQGEVAVKTDPISISHIFKTPILNSKGVLSLESRVLFSSQKPLTGEHMSFSFPGGEKIFYSVKGSGKLFSPLLEADRIKIEDLYVRAIWDHGQFLVEHFRFLYGKSIVEGNYRFNGDHFWAFACKSLEVGQLLRDFIGDDSFGLSGELSFRVEGKNRDFQISPVKTENLSYRGYKIFLKEISVSPDGASFFTKMPGFSFFCSGGSVEGGYVDEIQGEFRDGVLHAKLSTKGMHLKEIHWPFGVNPNDFDGLLHFYIDVRVDMVGRDWQILGRGGFDGLKISSFPLESSDYTFIYSPKKKEIIGDVFLPSHRGKIEWKFDESASKKLYCKIHGLDLAYLQDRFREISVFGVLDGEMELDLSETFSLRAKMQSKDAGLGFLHFSEPRFFLDLKDNRYQIKVVDQTSRYILASPRKNLSTFSWDFLVSSFSYLFSQDSQEKDFSGFTFSVEEENLSRYQQWLAEKGIHLDSGKIFVQGDITENDKNIQIQKLNVRAQKTTLTLDSPVKITQNKKVWNSDKFIFSYEDENMKGQWMQFWIDESLLFARSDDFSPLIFRDFYDSHWLLPLKGKVRFQLEYAFSKNPNLDLSFSTSELFVPSGWIRTSLDSQDKSLPSSFGIHQLFLDSLQGKIRMNSLGLFLEPLVLLKDKTPFEIRGQLPFVFSSQSLLPVLSSTMHGNLLVNLPRTPLSVFQDFFPSQIHKIEGSCQMQMEVKGDLQNFIANGDGDFSIKKLLLNFDDQDVEISDFSGKMIFDQKDVLLQEIRGKNKGIDFFLDGRWFPFDGNRFHFRGRAFKEEWREPWLQLKGARLENLFITGFPGSLQISSTLLWEDGILFYDDLTQWLNQEKSRFTLSGVDQFRIDVHIGSKNSRVRSNLFQLQVNPDFSLVYGNHGLILDGHASVESGFLKLARNRFQVESDSVIRFTPILEEQFSGIKKTPVQKERELWENPDFRFGSLMDKLDLMWSSDLVKEEKNVDAKSSLYRTHLSLRARTQIGKKNVYLSLKGPIDSLSYDLYSDDREMKKDDLLKLLAMNGVDVKNSLSSSLLQENSNVDNTDQRVLQAQLSAQIEDQILAKPFESLFHDLFRLDEISLEPNLFGVGEKIQRFRMGTRLGEDLFLSHEQENLRFSTKRKTSLEIRLDRELDLIFKREQEVERGSEEFLLEPSRNDFQLGFERRIRF